MARITDTERAEQLQAFITRHRERHGGQSPSDYAITKEFGWGAGVIHRIRGLVAAEGMQDVAESSEPNREEVQKREILNQLNQVLRPVVDTLHEHTMGREQRTREEMNQKLRDRSNTLERVGSDLASAQTRNESLETSVTELNDALSAARMDLKDKAGEIRHLTGQIQDRDDRLAEQKDALSSLKAAEVRLHDQMEHLQKAHAEQREADRQRIKDEHDRLRIELQESLNTAREQADRIRDLSDDLSQVNRERQNEQERRKAADDRCREATDERDTLQAKAKAQAATIAELQTEATSHASDTKVHTARIAELERATEALNTSLSLESQKKQTLRDELQTLTVSHRQELVALIERVGGERKQ